MIINIKTVRSLEIYIQQLIKNLNLVTVTWSKMILRMVFD